MEVVFVLLQNSRLEVQACEKDEQAVHFSDAAAGWENTLHQLESSDSIAFKSSRYILLSSLVFTVLRLFFDSGLLWTLLIQMPPTTKKNLYMIWIRKMTDA